MSHCIKQCCDGVTRGCNHATVIKCADPKPRRFCCSITTSSPEDCPGMPECRRCRFIHCKCGLCRRCRIYEYISSISTDARPEAGNNIDCNNPCRFGNSTQKRPKNKFLRPNPPAGGPLFSEYRAQFRSRKGPMQTNNCIYKKRPQGQSGADVVLLPQGLDFPVKPPWRYSMQVKQSAYKASLQAEESKLNELDRLLQKERQEMCNPEERC